MTYDASLRARPTVYRGIQMRSRLEAKWAAAFDKDGHLWEYEPRCFANQRGQYLPDFAVRFRWRSDETRYVEIKPPQTMAQILDVAERMEIIWDSEPDALLLLLAGGRLGRGSVWRGAGLDLLHGLKAVDCGPTESVGSDWTAVLA